MTEQSKSESIKLNLIFNIIYQGVIVLSPLFVTPKISRIFGLDYIGVKSYTFSIVYYFAIFGVLGLDMLGQRKIALVKDDLIARSKAFWTIYVARFFLVLISGTVYVGYAFIAQLSEIERTVTFCWGIYLIREMINPIWFLQGMEKYRLLSILGIISQISYVACTIVFINQKSDLPLYIIFYTVIPLLIALCYFPAVWKNIILVKPCMRELLETIQESVVYFIPTIATAIYSMIDKTMLGIYDPLKVSTGLYESAERLVKVALAFSTASFSIMRTRMSYIFGQNDKESYRKMCAVFMSFSLMLCWPIMFGVIGISKDFVPVFFGSGFEKVIELSYLFSLVVPCLTISGVLQAIYIFPYGLQKTMDYYYAIITAINIAMNLMLIPLLGTIGAILASVFSELLLAIILIMRARYDVDVFFLVKGSVKYVIASIAMLVMMYLISNFVSVNSLIKLAMEFLVSIITYFFVCLLLRDRFILEHIKMNHNI